MLRGGRTPLVAVVQRKKDKRWVLPRGKLKRKETAIAAARREVIEETGYVVATREYLGAISYLSGGRPKLVQFWRMQANGGPRRKVASDVRAVEWLPIESAIDKLAFPLEKLFLGHVAQRARKLRGRQSRRVKTTRKRKVARRNGRRRMRARANGAARRNWPGVFRRVLGRFGRRPARRTSVARK